MTGFLTEPEPARGVAVPVAPGVRRVVAPNPGPMTYHGTNTYLLDRPEGTVVLDPGPDSTAHVRAVLDAAGGRVGAIVLSHTHPDHLGATAALRAATGAPLYAWHRPDEPGLAVDVPLRDGDRAAGLVALHTPGHAADHVCFAADDGTGIFFGADHVMTWSTSVVRDMAAYFASLRRVLARDDRLLLPGHGPPMPEPRAHVQRLLEHRQAREDAILARLRRGAASGPAQETTETALTTQALTQALYPDVDARLMRAAERNVLAHLDKLAAEGKAVRDGEGWRGLG